MRAAVDGTMNVLPAVISAVFTTVAAFGTFFFLDGRLGGFARHSPSWSSAPHHL